MTPPQAHRENVLAAPVRYPRRGWTLKHKDQYVSCQSCSVVAAVTSEISGDGVGKATNGGGWHAAASY